MAAGNTSTAYSSSGAASGTQWPATAAALQRLEMLLRCSQWQDIKKPIVNMEASDLMDILLFSNPIQQADYDRAVQRWKLRPQLLQVHRCACDVMHADPHT